MTPENPIPIFAVGEKNVIMFGLSSADKEMKTVTNVAERLYR